MFTECSASVRIWTGSIDVGVIDVIRNGELPVRAHWQNKL